VSGAALALAVAGAGVAQVVRAASGCDPDRSQLEVAASPDIAATVSWVADVLHDPGGCPQVRVRTRSESDVLAALRQKAVRRPDVWIPDSSLWVERPAPTTSSTRRSSSRSH
jgi:hypothetical protein